MNILHLQTGINYSCGVTRSIFRLCKTGVAPMQVACFGGDAVDYFRDHGIPVTILPGKYNPLTLPRLLLLARRSGVTLLHAHHRYFDVLAAAASRLTGLPAVTTVHSLVRGARPFSYLSPRLIAPGNAVSSHLQNRFGVAGGRITVIYNAVDTAAIPSASGTVAALRLMNKKVPGDILLFTGRLDLEKGVDVLLQAFTAARRRLRGVSLVLIGAGPLAPQLQQTIDYENLPAVIMPPVKDALPFIAAAKAVVLPSRVDPFPITMLEAGLCAKPFIGSAVDGIAEFIRDGVTGRLVPPENPAALADAITVVFGNYTEALPLGAALHQAVVAQCSLTAYANATLQVYRSAGA